MALQSRIPEIVAALALETQRAVAHGADRIASDAVVRLNIIDPDPDEVLARAIHVEEQEDGVYVIAGDNEAAFYGEMVEHGTTHSSPRPFLVPALEENRAGIEADIAAAIRRAV